MQPTLGATKILVHESVVLATFTSCIIECKKYCCTINIHDMFVMNCTVGINLNWWYKDLCCHGNQCI